MAKAATSRKTRAAKSPTIGEAIVLGFGNMMQAVGQLIIPRLDALEKNGEEVKEDVGTLKGDIGEIRQRLDDMMDPQVLDQLTVPHLIEQMEFGARKKGAGK